MAASIETTRTKIEEITENIPETIEKCLGKRLKTDPIKQKIFIAKNSNGSLVVFVISNNQHGVVSLYISPNAKAEKPDLVEAIEELLRILPDKYDVKKIFVQIPDYNGVVKSALQAIGFLIIERKNKNITFEKKIHFNPEKAAAKKITKKIQEQIKTISHPSQPPKIPDKIEFPPIKKISIEKIVIPRDAIPVEQEQKTIQERIQAACKRFNLNGTQRSILEALMEKPLSENEIRLNPKVRGDIKGQLLFLQQQKLIKNVTIRGRYQINI